MMITEILLLMVLLAPPDVNDDYAHVVVSASSDFEACGVADFDGDGDLDIVFGGLLTEDVDFKDALKAAITTYQPTKNKLALHFEALAKATQSRAFRCAALTADSDKPTLEKACKELATALGKVLPSLKKKEQENGSAVEN